MTETPRQTESNQTEQSREFENDLLEVLYRAYPRDVWINVSHPRGGGDELRPLRQKYEKTFYEQFYPAVASLNQDGLITRVGDGTGAMISPEGMRELSRRRGMATVDDLDTLYRAIPEVTAKIAEVREATESSQQRLDARLGEVEATIGNTEREFYARVIPLLALVVSAFALLISGAQAATRITESDPVKLFQSSAAIMLPIGFVTALFVVVAWGITRVGTRGFWSAFAQTAAVLILVGVMMAILSVVIFSADRSLPLPQPSPSPSPTGAGNAIHPLPPQLAGDGERVSAGLAMMGAGVRAAHAASVAPPDEYRPLPARRPFSTRRTRFRSGPRRIARD